MKTSVTPRHRGDEQNFEKKLLKFWLQSFLLGVPHIIVGKRSPDGILQSVERINTAQIPGMVKRGGNNSWDGDMCINFANQILQCKSEALFILVVANKDSPESNYYR